jgi:hypothetical protein
VRARQGLGLPAVGGPPLIRSLRALLRGRGHERGAALLYLAVGLVAAVVATEPISGALVSELIAVHHLRPTSLPAWMLLQLVPKMYSLSHTCWIGAEPILERGDEGEDRFLRERFWVNHYPARRARFDSGRAALVGAGAERFVYVRSTYRGSSETTAFVVRRDPDRLVLRAVWVRR